MTFATASQSMSFSLLLGVCDTELRVSLNEACNAVTMPMMSKLGSKQLANLISGTTIDDWLLSVYD